MEETPQTEPNPVQQLIEPEIATIRSGLKLIKNRLISGIVLVLPVVVTFWILYKLYQVFRDYLIGPVAKAVIWVFRVETNLKKIILPAWFDDYGAPVLALVIILMFLYFLGMFLHSRVVRWLRRSVDWVLLHLPLVTTIYKAIRNVVGTLEKQREQSEKFKRVVLVEFPHPGIRVPAFVTSSCKDVPTGKTILCVYVPTTPVPTSGYMLLIPEEDVHELDWNLDETLQAVVSGGISVPNRVTYFSPHQ